MADDVEVTDQVDAQVDNENLEVDNDPMLIAMREAEKEIAEGGDTGEEGEGEQPQPEAKPAAEATKSPIMIPKQRLDEVIADRDRQKDANSYLQGVIETQRAMLAERGSATPAQQTGEQKPGPEGAKTDPAAPTDYQELISKAEEEKIELAQKYEDGEISLVELRKADIEIDRRIRGYDDKRIAEIEKGAEAKATETVNQAQLVQRLNDEGARIQKEHPYVAEIDKLPPAIRDGVWQEITDKAVINLAQKGINALDGSLQSRLALVREKASLTNEYGPRYTGVQINSQPKKASETAAQRGAKIDLANNQPPVLDGAGLGDKAELTALDLENMSQDEVADALARNPHLVNKAAGFRN